MTLNWSSKKCNPEFPIDDNDAVCREVLVYMMLATDIGWEITEKNAEDFYVRCTLMEKLIGPMRANGNKGIYFTPQEIKRWIGLECNVAPVKFHTWANRKLKNFVSDAKKDFNKED